MKKVQPAVETIICDVCQVERSWFMFGSRVEITATRRSGPMAEKSTALKKLDLCDDCSKKLDDILKLEW